MTKKQERTSCHGNKRGINERVKKEELTKRAVNAICEEKERETGTRENLLRCQYFRHVHYVSHFIKYDHRILRLMCGEARHKDTRHKILNTQKHKDIEQC